MGAESRGAALQIGVVAIGRNEGQRLVRCLESVVKFVRRVVYVDSGSSDRSVETARAMGVDVVELDMRVPFTAARARNEGFRRLRVSAEGLDYVQFVDGDCELAVGWLERAALFLGDHENVAAVCGRLRERFPEQSVYNMLCDIEWDTPVGGAKACGGIAMLRVAAFESMRGFRADLIAGEEPELCVRLRAAGWSIWRLGEEMALHDAAMMRFGQWWKRSVRAGFAYSQGVDLHGARPERHFVRESISAWFWGLALPLAILAAALWWGPLALALLLIYPLQIFRIAMRGAQHSARRWWFAVFIVLGKFPEVLGQMKFFLHRYLGGPSRLIEYK